MRIIQRKSDGGLRKVMAMGMERIYKFKMAEQTRLADDFHRCDKEWKHDTF